MSSDLTKKIPLCLNKYLLSQSYVRVKYWLHALHFQGDEKMHETFMLFTSIVTLLHVLL